MSRLVIASAEAKVPAQIVAAASTQAYLPSSYAGSAAPSSDADSAALLGARPKVGTFAPPVLAPSGTVSRPIWAVSSAAGLFPPASNPPTTTNWSSSGNVKFSTSIYSSQEPKMSIPTTHQFLGGLPSTGPQSSAGGWQPITSSSDGPVRGSTAVSSYPNHPAQLHPAGPFMPNYPLYTFAQPYPPYPNPIAYQSMIAGPQPMPVIPHSGQPGHSTGQNAVATSLPNTHSNSASGGSGGGVTGDSWIDHLGTANESGSSSSLKPPRIELQAFDGDPKEWPSFIAGFKILVHDTSQSDAQRMFLLRKYLGPQVREHIGESLLDPGLYQHALKELQRKYGNRQAVAQACTTKLLALQAFGDDDFLALRQFSATLRGVVATLKRGGYTSQLSCPATLMQLVDKLPRLLRKDWGKRSWSLDPKVPTLVDFDEWLDGIVMEEARAQPLVAIDDQSKQKHNNPSKRRNRNGPTTVLATGTTTACPACEKDHALGACQSFKDLPTDKRGELVLKRRCCFRCLRVGHRSTDCRRTKTCNKDGCKQKHHPLLHGVQLMARRNQSGSADDSSLNAQSASVIVSSTSEESSTGAVLLPIVPIAVTNGQTKIQTWALLDGGSQVSLIRSDVADRLGLKGHSENIKIGTFHARDPTLQVRRVNFTVASRDGTASFSVQGGIAVPNLNVSQRAIKIHRAKRAWPHLADVALPDVGTTEVTVLIGMDCSDAHDILETRKDPLRKNAPRALLTQFGWCLVGRVGSATANDQSCMLITSIKSTEQSPDTDLQNIADRYWSMEAFGSKPDVKIPISKQDKRAVETLNNTTRRINDRYEVGLLWRYDRPMLPDNRQQALRRFFTLEKRFAADPQYAAAYERTIEEYISCGHARPVKRGAKSPQAGRIFYLPHHGVRNPNKPGKIRVVFDASAKCDGVSLNDRLLKGPDLLTSLVGVLVRFRQHAVPVSADIEKMFLQVKVAKADRSALRFLWRPPGTSKPPKTYEMQVQIFGAACSPTICAHVLRRTAADNEREFPDLQTKVWDNFYVDNYLDSFESTDEAIATSRRMSEMLSRGGFKLAQWGSSSKTVLAALPGELRAKPSLDLDLDELPTEHTLGLKWNCQNDAFEMTVRVSKTANTRREILRAVAKVFDPLGFLTPVVMTGRVILQDLCRTKADWDAIIPPEIKDRWEKWAGSLRHLESISVPRCFRTTMTPPTSAQLHTFSDASEHGYGAVCYLRLEYHRAVTVAFIASRSRVAPLRFLTIPRLELNGAVLACRLAEVVKRELRVEVNEAHFWTDSTTVLRWLNSTSCRFQTFVANRIGEVLETSCPASWHYVPSESNPADDCSRGLDASTLSLAHRWFSGPDFLKSPPAEWPKFPDLQHPLTSDDPEIKRCLVNIQTNYSDPSPLDLLLQRRSSLPVIERTTARLIRLFVNSKRKEGRILGDLSVEEVRKGKLCLIRLAQQSCFDAELRDVAAGKPVAKGSRLLGLTPFLDDQSILRVGGRLVNAPITYDEQHPPILPPDHRLTELIIRKIHEDGAHSSTERTLAEFRLQYWAPKARSAIRKVISTCMTCRRLHSQPIMPIMAALPAHRVQPCSPPFTNVGIDMFGPLLVIMFRRTVKRYGLIVTCLTTRAVHLEVMHSMDMDSFVMAFGRFSQRRGTPAHVYCDNGTNFTAGSKEISDGIRRWNASNVAQKMSHRGTQWHFNPPSAPHFGGAWERLIRSAKSALRIVLNGRTLNDETLHSALIQVESLLNGRPLTHISVDPADPMALTPNHLLLGRANPNIPSDVIEDRDINSRKRWRIVQTIAEHFWRRWMREYLPHLIERRKWMMDRRNLNEGDIVLVVDNNTPRGHWPLGRVLKVLPGPDGVVRTALVKTSHSEFVRPVAKLCLLEERDPEDVSGHGNRAGDVTNDP